MLRDLLKYSPEVETVLNNPTVAELAKLSPLEYDKRRKQEANNLGVRVGTLDSAVGKARSQSISKNAEAQTDLIREPEAWPEAVEGAALLNEIAELFSRYIVLPDGACDFTALWVIHTYTHSASRISPIYCVSSPEKRCGKTTLLSLLQAVSYRSLSTSNITTAATFRMIDKCHPTLLIDEADTFLHDNNELRGVLNSGHMRDAAWLIRTEGDDHEPRRFSTWAPKAIAMIGRPHPTLIDRSIIINMRRKRRDEKVARLRLDRLNGTEEIRCRAKRWASDYMCELSKSDPAIPKGLNDRAVDNWEPLLAIADVAGGEWPEKARKAALIMNDNEIEDAAGVMLLQDIRHLFGKHGVSNLSSADLVTDLAEMEDRPWPEWYRGRPITTRQVARLLKPFEITSKNLRIDDKVPKGYELNQFTDAFTRYLPDESATPLHGGNNSDFIPFQSATHDIIVADKNKSNPLKNKNCSGVADVSEKNIGTAWNGELAQRYKETFEGIPCWPRQTKKLAEDEAYVLEPDLPKGF